MNHMAVAGLTRDPSGDAWPWTKQLRLAGALLAKEPAETNAVSVTARLDTGAVEEARAFGKACRRLADARSLCAAVRIDGAFASVRFCHCSPERAAHARCGDRVGTDLPETKPPPAVPTAGARPRRASADGQMRIRGVATAPERREPKSNPQPPY